MDEPNSYTCLLYTSFYDAGNILCDEISMEEGQRLLGLAVEKLLEMKMFPIVLLSLIHISPVKHTQPEKYRIGKIPQKEKGYECADNGILHREVFDFLW